MQHKHDFARSTPRLATALFVVSRGLLVRRRADTVTRL
jgi:hypothetical protein